MPELLNWYMCDVMTVSNNKSKSVFSHPISFHVNLYTPDIEKY